MRDEGYKSIEIGCNRDQFVESSFDRTGCVERLNGVKRLQGRTDELGMLFERVFRWHGVDRKGIERSRAHENR